MQPPKSNPASSAPKGPWEKRGSIPREKFIELFKRGPYSMTYSRNRGQQDLKKMGERILSERFSRHYGGELGGREIQREINGLRAEKIRAKTSADRGKIQETIVRLEEAKKRAGL